MLAHGPLVSVIVPCYNQARFLSEAIESVLVQTYPPHEIIIVDDGSTDGTAQVAARYPEARYLRQENQGTAAARNTGFHESNGECLIFLDADDRLLPEALGTSLNCLSAHPECGLVFGLCKLIAQDGSPLHRSQKPYCESDHYRAMLQRCPIRHPAAAMCRRNVFASTPGFDTSLAVCSDYEFYLRVARSWPVHCHNTVVSEYRQHAANKSLDHGKMLKYTRSILRSQRPFVKGKTGYEEAYRLGMKNSRVHYCNQALKQLSAYVHAGGNRRQALRNVLMLLHYAPQMLLRRACRKSFRLLSKAGTEWFSRIRGSKGSTEDYQKP